MCCVGEGGGVASFFSLMSVKVIHVVDLAMAYSSLLASGIPLGEYITICLSSHPLVAICFQFLTIVSSSMNTRMQIFQMYVFFSCLVGLLLLLSF